MLQMPLHATAHDRAPSDVPGRFAAIAPSRFLRRALLADAAVSGVTGVAQTLDGAALASATALPSLLVTGTGAFMLVYAALLIGTLTRARVWNWWLWVLVVGNAAWAVASLELLVGGAMHPAVTGEILLAAHCVATAAFAALEWAGWRRSRQIGNLAA